MAIIGMRQAAKAVGVTRQTLYRYVKDGRISKVIMDNGQAGIDTSELIRVFGALKPETPADSHVTVAELPDETAERQALEVELGLVRAALDNASRELEATKERESRLLGIIESQTRLLEDKRPARSAAPVALLAVLLLVVILAAVAVLLPRM